MPGASAKGYCPLHPSMGKGVPDMPCDLTSSNWHQNGTYSKDTHLLVEGVPVWLSMKRMQGQFRSFSWELDQRRQTWVGGAETARTPQGTKKAEESKKDLEARVSMSQT